MTERRSSPEPDVVGRALPRPSDISGAGGKVAVDLGLMSSDPLLAGDRARELEELGADGAYSVDGPHDPFTSLVTAAGTTDRMLLYSAIAVAFARNPMLVAQQANDLQRLTGGRFALGLGTQIKPHVERRFSMPWSDPVGRMRDFVAATRAIWAAWHGDGQLDHQGKHYQHTLMTPLFVPPVPAEPPPIWLAAVGPRMLALAGEVADGLLVHPFHSGEHLQEQILPALRDAHVAADRDAPLPTVIAQTMVAIGHDAASVAAARAATKHQLGFYASTPAYQDVLDRHGFDGLRERAAEVIRGGGWAGLTDVVPDELVDLLVVSGTPDEVAEELRRRCVGVQRIGLVPYGHDDSPGSLAELVRELHDTTPSA